MQIIDRVWFRKPEIARLKRQDFALVDMHIHSHCSDGFMSVKSILKKANKLGIGVSLTDHNEIKGSLELAKENILVIPGIEINAIDGRDIIVYFYTFDELKEFYEKHIAAYKHKQLIGRAYKTVREAIENTEDYNCVVTLPHPFGYALKNMKRLLKNNGDIIKKVDSIEVINSEQTKRRNLKALDLAQRYNKCFTAGTDAHTLSEVGNVVVYSKGQDVESFLNEIKKKRNFIMGKETNKVRCAVVASGLAGRHVKHPVSVGKTYYRHTFRPNIKNIKPKLREIKEKRKQRLNQKLKL